MNPRIIKCLVGSLCACVALNVAIRGVSGQTFRYEPKPKAASTGPSYASPDPAPRMMVPSEQQPPGQSQPQRRYLYSPYSRGGMAQRMRYESGPSTYEGRTSRVVPHPAGVESIPPGQQVDPFSEQMPVDGPIDGTFEGEGPADGFVDEASDGCSGDGYGGCDRCAPCYRDLMDCFCCCLRQTYLFSPAMRENLSLYTGKQGFKNPTDLGVNGDFGFHGGVNWGSPMSDRFGIGYQLGGTIVGSDFEGRSGPLQHRRTQYFVTTGLFHRAQCDQGLQGGAVFDYLHDEFYVSMNLMQIRGEISYLYKRHELGFWFAAHTNTDTQSANSFLEQSTVSWKANDQYNLFYRYQFCNGAVARSWAGLSSHADGIFGGDATLGFSPRWALQTSYNYLLPRNDTSIPNNTKESWNLTVSLVWYPGYNGTCDWFNPNRPLFSVADNGWFMETTRN